MNKKIMGIDFGDVRTGVAVSDAMGLLASGRGTLKGGFEKTAQGVSELARENGVSKIVLGHPINMNGTLGERSEKIKAFAARVEELCGIEVELYDERLSTANAHQILNVTNTRGEKRKSIIDEMSACLILQSYLDRERAKNNG